MEQEFLKMAISRLKIISMILLIWTLMWIYLYQLFDADRSQQSNELPVFGSVITDPGCCNKNIANGIATSYLIELGSEANS